MNKKITLNAIILAGGLGTRLRPVIEGQPKVLAEIKGNPFLKYLLDQLVSCGIEKIILCTGYLGEQISSYFGNNYRGAELVYSQEPKPLGTGGALRFALPHVTTESVLVLNGDSYCAADFFGFSQWHCRHNAAASLLLTELTDTRRFGRVQMAENSAITRFDEKDESVIQPGLINAGIYIISRDLLEKIPENAPCSLEREMFPNWIGHNFYGYRTEAPFLDIGTPESYSKAEAFLANISEPST